jgi:hypothetical protein
MKSLMLIVGGLLVLVGVIFALQGAGAIGGSAMSGVTFWAYAGPVVAVIGLVIAFLGVRQRSGP